MVDIIAGLCVGAGHNAQTYLSSFPAIVMAQVKLIPINYVISVNPFATNAVKTTLIHPWWCDETGRIHPAQRISDPPSAYISMVNELSQ